MFGRLVVGDPRRDGLVQWLFLNKHLNHWKSTRATAEVIYSLVHYLDAEGTLGAREEAKVRIADQRWEFTFEPDEYTGKDNHIVLSGDEAVGPETAEIQVSKETPGYLFASATWHFSTEKLPEEAPASEAPAASEAAKEEPKEEPKAAEPETAPATEESRAEEATASLEDKAEETEQAKEADGEVKDEKEKAAS